MSISTAKKSANPKQTQSTPDVHLDATQSLHLLGRWNVEIAALYGKRIQECCMFPFNLLLCTSPDDVTDAQEKFSRILMANYKSAAQKLARTVAGDVRDDHGASEVYAATLLKAQEDARNILDQAKAQAQRILDTAAASAETQTPDTQAAVPQTQAA